jgi:hypothetical protein
LTFPPRYHVASRNLPLTMPVSTPDMPRHSIGTTATRRRVVSQATEGSRNNLVHWAGCRLSERVAAGELGAGEAADTLLHAAFGLRPAGRRSTPHDPISIGGAAQ